MKDRGGKNRSRSKRSTISNPSGTGGSFKMSEMAQSRTSMSAKSSNQTVI